MQWHQRTICPNFENCETQELKPKLPAAQCIRGITAGNPDHGQYGRATGTEPGPCHTSQGSAGPTSRRKNWLLWRYVGLVRACLRNADIRAKLSSIFQGTREDVEENRQRIESLENEVERLSLEVDALEQYGRRNAFRIYNPDWKEQMDENTDDMIMDVIINKLKLSDFPRWLISRSHRVGKPRTQEDRPRPILVKFISYRAIEAVMSAGKHLPRGTYINEDLTGATYRLAYQVRELRRANKVSDTLTCDGRVYIKTTQAIRGTVVRTLEDIFEKLTNDTAWNRPTTQSNCDQGIQMQRATPQATPQRTSTTNKGPRHSTAPHPKVSCLECIDLRKKPLFRPQGVPVPHHWQLGLPPPPSPRLRWQTTGTMRRRRRLPVPTKETIDQRCPRQI